MDPITILAALGPLIVDGGKAIIQKYFAPAEFKPTNIDDYVKMRQIDLDMFRAMNDAGGTNASYPWVEACVRLMRPSVAVAVLGTWAYMHLTATAPVLPTATDFDPLSTVDNFASAIGFYLFGDRTLFYARNGLKKPGA